MDMNNMTPEAIAQALDINVANQDILKTNQTLINKYKTLPSFCCYLLEISCNISDKYPKEIELNGAIQLKNYISSYWRFTNNPKVNKSLLFEEEEEQIIIVKDNDKQYIRSNILDAVIHSIENEKVKVLKQLNQSIKRILKLDFKSLWKDDYFKKIVDCFHSNNQKKVYAGIILLHQVSKIYEYEDQEETMVYNEEFSKVNNFLLNVLNECLDLNNPVQAQFVYKIMKIFKKNLQGAIPLCITEKQNFFLWSSQVERIIKTPLDQPNYPITSVFWKLKRIAYQTIQRIYSKYANKNGNDVTEFQKELVDKYTPLYLEMIRTIFINESHHLVYIDDSCMSCILSFFSYLLVNRDYPDEVLKIFEDNKAKDLIIKSAMITKADLDLWFNEPKTYINKQIEELSYCFTKRYSAYKISNALLNYKKPNTKRPLMYDHLFQYYLTMLQMNQEGLMKENELIQSQTDQTYSLEKLNHNLIKESIMYLLGLSYNVVIHYSKNVLDEFIEKYIISELESPLGLLREKACVFIRHYEKYQYTNQELVSLIIPKVCKLLQNDTHLPVKIFSALVASSLLKQPNGKIPLQGNIKILMNIYINLMEETDLEEIVISIQKVIKEFTQESTEFIIQLFDYLIKYFTKLTKRESDEEKMRETASLISNLISTFVNIIHYFANNDIIYPQLEKYIEVVLDYCIKNDTSDKLTDGLDIVFEIAKTKNTIPANLWNYFKPIICYVVGSDEELEEFKQKFPNNIFEGIGFEDIDDITSIICLMIAKDPETFMKGTDEKGNPFLNLTFRLVKSIVEISEGSDKYHQIYCAVDILMLLFDTFKGKIDAVYQEILKFITAKMVKKDKDYREQIKLLIASSFLYNPIAFLSYYQSTNEIEKIITFWLDQLKGIKNKKLIHHHLIALTTLISIEPSQQNQFVKNNMNQLFEIIIKLAKSSDGIKEKEVDTLDDDDYEELEDEEEGNEDGKELYQKLLKGELDDEDDEDIDSLYNAENFNNLKITLLDKQNELYFLRDTLKKISETNGEYYNSIQIVLGDQILALKEIIDKEEKRQLAKKEKANN